MAALADRGLITLDQRGTRFGVMRTVALTRAGRAAARAGTSLAPGPTPKAALSPRAWEVLALLWARGQAGETLAWSFSSTIQYVLIDKHDPPLARNLGGGYEITDRGREYYRQHHAAHTAAHPDVHAPHPDGTAAEPWPPHADDILAQHQGHYRALCAAWRAARDAQHAAEAEASAAAPPSDPHLPGDVAALVAARHTLWLDTARQRVTIAADHAAELHPRAVRAAHAYAAAALTVFHAAVAAADPRDGLAPPDHGDAWDEPRLPPPTETGVHAIDTAAKKLHAAAVGAPLRRRGPAPRFRPGVRLGRGDRAEQPGAALAALADFLRDHTGGGALLRRLHPDTVEGRIGDSRRRLRDGALRRDAQHRGGRSGPPP